MQEVSAPARVAAFSDGPSAADELESVEVHVFVALLAAVFAVAVTVGAWCILVCGGWGGVKSCGFKRKWFIPYAAEAVCKR